MQRRSWLLFTLLLAATPLLAPGSFAQTLASQAGVAIILALSWNMLYGQTGLLSFSHAVYSGIGALVAIHALRAIGTTSSLSAPLAAALPALLPLAGGVGAALAALLLGYVSSRRGGLTFAMITLAIGEMVAIGASLFPALAGGESGLTANRAVIPDLDFGFASARSVCALIATWTWLCALAMYAFTRTPLAATAAAVRDSPERASGLGIDPRRVRWLVTIAAAFFAGIAGSLSAILFEIVSAENLNLHASTAMLIAAYIGGTASFAGPIVGGIAYTLFAVGVAAVSSAWPIYLGTLFIALVLGAPGGLISLPQLARQHLARRTTPQRLVSVFAVAAILMGFVGLTESAYALTGRIGSAAALLAQFPGGQMGGLLLSGVLLIAGLRAWEYAARRQSAHHAGSQTPVQATSETRP